VTAQARLRRLRWRCRRGMKELDVLLERFLERQEACLARGGWPELEALLDTEDDQLWEWMRNPSAPGSGPYRRLIESICDDAG
jgi:antitoxin CptB